MDAAEVVAAAARQRRWEPSVDLVVEVGVVSSLCQSFYRQLADQSFQEEVVAEDARQLRWEPSADLGVAAAVVRRLTPVF